MDYQGVTVKICIVCPIHGEFWQTPVNHLKGSGCPKCAKSSSGEEKSSKRDEFIRRAREIHGDKYDYSQITTYNHGKEEVTIVCPVHGPFTQTFNVHLMGCGCPQCGQDVRSQKAIKGREVFIERAKAIHGGDYDYSLVPDDMKITDKVPIICHHTNANGEEHGIFYQVAGNHTRGCGCPRCAHRESKAQSEIETFVRSLLPPNTVVLADDREVLDGQELDIYIPSKKLAIEYNGMIWHSEYTNKGRSYHLSKFNKCKEKGIRLIQILEADYLLRKNIVLDKISNILGGSKSKERIAARKCQVRLIEKKDAEVFFTANHIQGFAISGRYIGAFYKGQLMAVMSFKQESKGMWNLTRFATDIRYHCVGMGGKLFSYFLKNR